MRTVLICLLIFAQLGCADHDIDMQLFVDDVDIVSMNGTWEVLSFENYADKSREFKTEENSDGLDIVITFDDTKTPHEFSGNNTRNSVVGTFVYPMTRKFKVITYFSTEVAQPIWGDKFNEALASGEMEFKVNKTELRLFYDSGARSVTLSRR